jgi:hypothetical protein
MDNNPAERIRALKEEYQERSSAEQETAVDVTSEVYPSKNVRIGHIWFDSSTDELRVCVGRVNGKLKWSKVC